LEAGVAVAVAPEVAVGAAAVAAPEVVVVAAVVAVAASKLPHRPQLKQVRRLHQPCNSEVAVVVASAAVDADLAFRRASTR
jgi:hypothetical protein